MEVEQVGIPLPYPLSVFPSDLAWMHISPEQLFNQGCALISPSGQASLPWLVYFVDSSQARVFSPMDGELNAVQRSRTVLGGTLCFTLVSIVLRDLSRLPLPADLKESSLPVSTSNWMPTSSHLLATGSRKVTKPARSAQVSFPSGISVEIIA